MATDHRATLARIKRFDQLIVYLRDELGWPIAQDSFEEVDDLFYDFTAEELGIDPKTAAKIESIKRLRPLSTRQPWGIFFIKFEPKRLPVVALRRVLSQVALKKRASANSAERTAWSADDLLFVSNYGEGNERQISFAHFSQAETKHDMPTLKVLGWDNLDTALHLDAVAEKLTHDLAWPDNDKDVEAWRKSWRAAFTVRHREVITTSHDLSIRLAELARAIRDRIRTVLAIEAENGRVTRLMKAFQEALVHDLDEGGFADMYAQTIAYGLLSARITNPMANTADGFAAQLPVTNPFLKELMEAFLHVGGRKGKIGRGAGIDFDELGVSEVVELLDDANMEAVVRDFGDKNPQEDPVIHFYELFLKEYDKKQKVSRGVFYTPRPVVSYIVRSVHELLQTEFGLPDGLADTTTWGEMARRHKDLTIPEGTSPEQAFVQILDPATGTGTFLVEVIDLIHKTLAAKWKAQGHGEKKILDFWNDYVAKHLLPRLHGYELLMAPYAIAHLKIGLKLHETGYRFGSDERARIYLTNSLEPAHDFSGKFEFMIPALANEAEAVNIVKRQQRFTVVMGNPPYSISSSNLSEKHRAIVEPYKFIDGTRIVERGARQFEKNIQDDYVKFIRFAELIINSASAGLVGYVTNHSFLTNPTFRGLRYSLLHTFRRADFVDLHGNSLYGEAKQGHPDDENVFDIRQGVSISLLRLPTRDLESSFARVDYWGSREEKYRALNGRTLFLDNVKRVTLNPGPDFWVYRSEDSQLRMEYQSFPRLSELLPLNSTGVKTHRDHFALAFDRSILESRIRAFRDLAFGDDEIERRFDLGNTDAWRLHEKRRALAARKDWNRFVARILHRPFDLKWIYYHPDVIELPRTEVMQHLLNGEGSNIALCYPRNLREEWKYHAFVSRNIVHKDALSSLDTCYAAPLFLRPAGELILPQEAPPNLTEGTRGWLRSLKLPACNRTYEDLLGYFYSVLYAPSFGSRYADFLRIDFPRLPLTSSLDTFRALAKLGGELISLHLMESPKLDKHLTRFVGGPNAEVEKITWLRDCVWLDKAQTTGFDGVQESVWNFHIGGYQVSEKWLKDRKGRTLSEDDIAHYQKIIVALSESIRLMREIDEVIDAHGGWPGAFQSENAGERDPEHLPKVAELRAEYNARKDKRKR